MATDVHYHDYLQLDKILAAQSPESDKHNLPAHDEMLSKQALTKNTVNGKHTK